MIDSDLRTLTVAEAADLLGVRPEAVRIWIREGRLEAMRWGRRLRVRPEAVRAFQAAAVIVPASAQAGATVRRLHARVRSADRGARNEQRP